MTGRYAGQGLYYNPDSSPEGKVRIDGHATDVVTDLAVDWLKKKRSMTSPSCSWSEHRTALDADVAPSKLYNDIDIPEPDTLLSSQDNASAQHQEMEIDRHMDPNYDLFVDLTADFAGTPIKGKTAPRVAI